MVVRGARRLLLRRTAALLLAIALVGAATLVVHLLSSRSPASAVGCEAAVGTAAYQLDLEQAANATTVAAVGKRLAMPDHAVTVALAAALQESGLRNLAHGDRDSLGLFQQRPSQGWGTPAQVMTPHYAAAAFYQKLAQVDGWATLSVADAAQQVQRSAAPGAYAQWEGEARGLAQVLTGEVSAGFTCRFHPAGGTLTADFSRALLQEVGSPNVDTALSAPRGWTVASWLVGHAWRYRITSVAFGGRRWVPQAGTWMPSSAADARVQILPPVVASSQLAVRSSGRAPAGS